MLKKHEKQVNSYRQAVRPQSCIAGPSFAGDLQREKQRFRLKKTEPPLAKNRGSVASKKRLFHPPEKGLKCGTANGTLFRLHKELFHRLLHHFIKQRANA